MMKIIKISLLLSTVLLLAISCKTVAQKSNILSVSYMHTAGRGGSSSITATIDSLESSAVGGRFQDVPNFKKKINSKDWDQLVSKINISDLEKTESGRQQGIFDGPDAIFRIKTRDKEYEIYNPKESTQGYKQLNELRNSLNNLRSKYKN
ncbi:hypothetical protein [Chryseobacterium sp. T1]